MTRQQTSERRPPWFSGALDASPIVAGYLPIGLTFGVLAQNAGLSGVNALTMSLLVYAGSSQLVAAGLFQAGAPASSIILTTFIINLRHLLLSAALAPFLRQWRKGELAAFAYQLTDETFALHAARFRSGVPDKSRVFAANVTAQLAWLLGTAVGVALGQIIGDVTPLGLDFVLPALFIALAVFQIEEVAQIAVACIAGALSVGLLIMDISQWNVIIATLVGASAGVFIENLWNSKRSS